MIHREKLWKVLSAACFILMMIFVATFLYEIYSYQIYLGSFSEFELEWGEPYPFSLWSPLFPILTVGVVANGIILILFAIDHTVILTRARLALLFLLFSVASASIIGIVFAPIPRPPMQIHKIRTICILDEEFSSGFDNFEEASQFATSQIYDACYNNHDGTTECLNSVFGIQLIVIDCVRWNSGNNLLVALNLLKEAILETFYERREILKDELLSIEGTTPFEPQDYVKDGISYQIDVLLIFTGQSMDMIGLSPPSYNALILDRCFSKLIKHEVSHQFWVHHCNDSSCYMCEDVSKVLAANHWCDCCKQNLDAHVGKYEEGFVMPQKKYIIKTTSQQPFCLPNDLVGINVIVTYLDDETGEIIKSLCLRVFYGFISHS